MNILYYLIILISIKKIFSNENDKYKIIINKISNYNILSDEELIHINTLPKDELFKIIKLYNNYINEITTIFNYELFNNS
jgi:hypothetical protein